MSTAPFRRTYRGLIAVGLALHVIAVLALTAWLYGPIVVPREDWEPPPNANEANAAHVPVLDPGWIEVNRLPRDDTPEPSLSTEARW